MASVGCPSLIKAGSPCIHMSWIVPADKEAEVDAFWKRHEKWMRETHTIGVVYPEDEAKPKLLHYYISKGPQMKDPMKPEEGTTGNFVYQMAESYVSDEDLKNHLKCASETFEDFKNGTMMKYLGEYGNHSAVGSDKIWCGMAE